MNLETAVPAKHFAHPPYTAEEFTPGGWAGVMNAVGVNALTFSNAPGRVVTDFESAKGIAANWNGLNSLA